MTTEKTKFVVTTAAEADEAEKAAAAFRLTARNEKFRALRKTLNADVYDTMRADVQTVIDAGTFDDDPATSLALQNVVMAMGHLKGLAA